jgi:hypothetical protein
MISVERRHKGLPLSPPASVTSANGPGRASVVFVAMMPSSRRSCRIWRMSSICGQVRSGAIFRKIGRRPPIAAASRSALAFLESAEQLDEAVVLLELAQVRRIRAADIDRDVIGVIGEQRKAA